MTGYAFATALAAPVCTLHRSIHSKLRGGCCVNCCHEPLLDAELLIDNFDKWSEAIRGARGTRDDFHRCLVVIGIDSNDNRRSVSILGWCGNDHFLRTTIDVLHAAFGSRERASGLANILHAGIAPWDLGWVASGREANRETIDDKAII